MTELRPTHPDMGTPLPKPFLISVHDTAESFPCAADVNVLAAMERAHRHGIPVGCRNGGCGACKIRITAGRFETQKMNLAVVSIAEEATGCALACRTFPRSDLSLQVLGRVWGPTKTFQRTSFDFGFRATYQIDQPGKET